MESYFRKFRDNIIGIDLRYTAANGRKLGMIYADWIASGRLYRPIEEKMFREIGPFVANTHTETSEAGTLMTRAYHRAHERIKQHVNAAEDDVIITVGTGMTCAVNKLIRILGLRIGGENESELLRELQKKRSPERPVVFVTHMEHHSNQTPWLESIAEVVIVPPGKDLLVDPGNLEREVKKYRDRRVKIGAFSACSNVTGIMVPIHDLATVMHHHGGICLADFAASAPYVNIDMHPGDPDQRLDGIYFSPHKFLGGPGSSGVLIFNSSLYRRKVPDHPGGGTVIWTNPWGEHRYFEDIELREDGGTPGFLQAIRGALAIGLKETMGTEQMDRREKQLLERAFRGFSSLPDLVVLAAGSRNRIGCISFYSPEIHYNLIVKLLSDRFGIQVRGGCTCAGTYGHMLLNVDRRTSRSITTKIDRGDLSEKPGWVRLSIHPTMTDGELDAVLEALRQISRNWRKWRQEYRYCPHHNEFYLQDPVSFHTDKIRQWFELDVN
jgi:selenocysteine lyase/cysteine desulfurase